MNEQEWLASEDPTRMLEWLTTAHVRPGQYSRTISDRKSRLFACACCRAADPMGRDWSSFLSAVAQLELVADGVPGASSMLVDQYFHPEWDAATLAAWSARGVPNASALLREIAGNPFRPQPYYFFDGKMYPLVPADVPMNGGRFDPIPWLTPTVLSLAHAAYEERGRKCDAKCEPKRSLRPEGEWCVWDEQKRRWERCEKCRGVGTIDDGTLDPARLAVLSDALEEAGCVETSDETVMGIYVCEKCDAVTKVGVDGIKCGRCGSEFCRKQRLRDLPHPLLAHLRSPGPHVRGCWVLDLLLGKE